MLSDAPPRLARLWEYGGLAGMALSAVAVVFAALAIGPWVRTATDSFDVLSGALEAIDSTVEVVDESLVVFTETLVGVDGVFSETDATLAEVSTVVLATGGLLQEDIPGQIDSIQSAMDGLIDTANIVDGVLGALSFVGVDYDPAVPLDEALIDVNDQLGDLGDSLSGFAADLFSLTVSVNRLNDEVGEVGATLSGLSGQVEDSRGLIAEYQETATTARVVIDSASDRLTAQVWLIRLLGVGLLLALVPLFSLLWWTGRSARLGSPG